MFCINNSYVPADPKFQRTAPVQTDEYISRNLQAGKSFEQEFAIAFRKTGLRLDRLMDNRYNKPDCDHFAVISPQHGLPGMILFDEAKSTGCRELPLEDIKSHQLEAMAKYDHAFPGMYAGFVVHYRSVPNEPVIYLPGKAVQAYVEAYSSARYLPTGYVSEHGIPVPQFTAPSDMRMRNRLDIQTFLETLSKT